MILLNKLIIRDIFMSIDLKKLDEIILPYKNSKGALIPILQKTQEEFGYLSEDAMRYIAEALKLNPSDVYGVASFYAQFRFTPLVNIV